jgi:hypothetical protein
MAAPRHLVEQINPPFEEFETVVLLFPDGAVISVITLFFSEDLTLNI